MIIIAVINNNTMTMKVKITVMTMIINNNDNSNRVVVAGYTLLNKPHNKMLPHYFLYLRVTIRKEPKKVQRINDKKEKNIEKPKLRLKHAVKTQTFPLARITTIMIII